MVRGLKIFINCLLSLLLISTSVALAEEEKKEEKAYKFEEITVIAPQPGVEITTEKTTIHMDEFKKPGTVRNLTDVLEEIGGIDIQRSNPLLASPGDEVSIRGLNEGRMVIEIDGRRVDFTGHNGRYIVDWSSLNMDDVERIEIIRGGHSVLHPFAMGGVINIITKKGEKTDKIKPDFNVFSSFGSYDTKNYGASVNGGAANFIGYHFSASKQETDGYLRNNFQDNGSFNGHLTFWLPKDAKLSIGFKTANVKYGFPVLNDPSRSDYDSDYPKFFGGADQLRHLPNIAQLPGPPKPYWERETYYLDGALDIPLGPGIFHAVLHQNYGKRDIYAYDASGNYSHSIIKDRTRGLISEYRDVSLFGFNLLTFGFDYQELGDPDNDPMIYIVKSAYIQDVISLLDGRLKLTPGVRYYNIDMDTYYAWFEQGKTSPAFPTGGKTQTENGWFPSFKADFQATPTTALYAYVSRSTRLPCP